MQIWVLRVLVGLVALAAGAGFVWLWWVGIPLLYADVADVKPPDRLIAVTNTRSALLTGLIGVGAVGTFWLNGRAQRFTAETLRVSQQTYRITERGHLTDRYSKAIEQLGNDKLDVRLGGIYALEQLATDSAHARDQDTIVEVLSAFVRVHSDLALVVTDSPQDITAEEQAAAQEGTRRREAAAELVHRERFPVDVQAALTVLGRLPVRPGRTFVATDLSYARLSWAQLAYANLSGADLAGADLRHVNLTRADLSAAQLDYAKLGGAWLGGANLTGARPTGAKLQGAYFGPAGSRLALRAALLRNADLVGADMAGVYLSEVDLTNADLDAADLRGAHLRKAEGLTHAQLAMTFGDEKTELPEGLVPPANWHLNKPGSGS